MTQVEIEAELKNLHQALAQMQEQRDHKNRVWRLVLILIGASAVAVVAFSLIDIGIQLMSTDDRLHHMLSSILSSLSFSFLPLIFLAIALSADVDRNLPRRVTA
jgi:hypothetical protein